MIKQKTRNDLKQKKDGWRRRIWPVPCSGRISGFTLIEIMISIVIVMVLVTGAMGYQYYSAADVKISEVKATAARVSMLLLEGWKGDQGAGDFDPVSLFSSQLNITKSTVGPDAPPNESGMNFTVLGKYRVQVNDIYYYITLSSDAASSFEPLTLNIQTTWRSDYGNGTLDGDEDAVQYSTFYVDY